MSVCDRLWVYGYVNNILTISGITKKKTNEINYLFIQSHFWTKTTQNSLSHFGKNDSNWS